MDVRSTSYRYTPKTQTGIARETTPEPQRAGVPISPPADTRVDRVELSPVARELSARIGSTLPEAPGDLSAEKLLLISGRIASGYYDQPESIDRDLNGVLGEPGSDASK